MKCMSINIHKNKESYVIPNIGSHLALCLARKMKPMKMILK